VKKLKLGTAVGTKLCLKRGVENMNEDRGEKELGEGRLGT